MRVTFDCGRAGRVTWEVPEAGLTKDATPAMFQIAWGETISRFFQLIVGMMLVGGPALRPGMRELDAALQLVAAKAAARAR